MIDSDELDLNMLKTILLPNNILHLSDRLPNANYDPIKTKLSSQFTKSTLVHLGDSSSKIGLEDQKELLENMKGKNASRSSSDHKRQNNGHNIMERIFNDNASNAPHTQGVDPLPSSKLQRSIIQQKAHGRERNNSESMPVLKKPLVIEMDRQNFMKSEKLKIEAEINKYNQILKSQKDKIKGKNSSVMKSKIEMILGKERSSLSNANLKAQPKDLGLKMKIYGKQLNQDSVKNMSLLPNYHAERDKDGAGRSSPNKKKSFKLPHLS